MKLTDANVASTVAAARDQWIADDELHSFYLRVRPSGAKSFVLKYSRRGLSRTVTIGRCEHWTAAKARAEARQLLAAVDRGADPAAERAAGRAALNLSEVATEWLGFNPVGGKPKRAARRKASTQAGYADILRLHVLPKLGKLRLEDVGTATLGRVAKSLSDRPALRNKTLRVMSSLFTWAAKNGHCAKGYNPASASEIDRVAEEARSRFLTADEMIRLGAVLAEVHSAGLPVSAGDDDAPRRTAADPHAAAAVKLLLLTGCRLREILHLRWNDIDEERGLLNLPEAKRGKRSVILNAPALQILASLPRTGEFVIASSDPTRPRADVKRVWDRIRAAAGLEGVRIHDLRHTAGAVAASSGLGLQITGALLGHKSTQATARYAHLANEPLRRAAERVGGEIAGHLGLAPDARQAEVFELPRRVR